MEGRRFLGQDVEIQRQAHGEYQGAKVSEVVYAQTPSDPDKTDIASVREALSQHQKHLPTTPEEDSPKSFKEMLAPNEGDTRLQRLAKWYIRPSGNPETTMKVLEALQVHRFQELPKLLAKRSNKKQRSQSFDTIKDSRLSSLIDYATHKTLMNEIGHLAGLGITLAAGVIGAATGNETLLRMQWSAGVLHTYCILAQRYSRARCERLIDRGLAKGKSINRYEYENTLNLNLPQE